MIIACLLAAVLSPTSGLRISNAAPGEMQESPEQDITKSVGDKDKPFVWPRQSYEEKQSAKKEFADFDRNVHVPVFIFNPQMKKAILEWADIQGLYVAVDWNSADLYKKRIHTAMAFVRDFKPKVAVWLVENRFGKHDGSLYHGLFNKTKNDTKHIVFHWAPEYCNEGKASAKNIAPAFQDAEAVFMYGYQDERLSKLDKEKYLPWPLGVPHYKGGNVPTGYHQPASSLPMSERDILISFRGANTTHPDLDSVTDLLKDHEDIVIESSGGWKQADSKESKSRYNYLKTHSKYGLNIGGANPQCFRVMELVEANTIPIILVAEKQHLQHDKDGTCYANWAAVYGHPVGADYVSWDWIPKAPFEVISSYSDLNFTRLTQMESRALDEARQQELGDWYDAWRQAFRAKFYEKFQKVIEKADMSDFDIQSIAAP